MKKILKNLAIKVYYGNSFFRKGIRFGQNLYIRERAHIVGGGNVNIGNNSSISFDARIMCFENIAGIKLNPKLTIGNNVFIGRNVTLSCSNKIEIGDDSLITGYCFICDSEHGMDPECGKRYEIQPMITKETKIGKNVFLGEKSIILPGVSIGDNCIVGAGSVVTKSFGEYCMLAGNPAKCIKKYNLTSHEWEKVNE